MLIQEMAKWMSRMEGFSQPATPAWRNNNPGNLDAGPRASSKDARGYAVYAKLADGWADFEDQIERTIRNHPQLTLTTFFAGERDSAGSVVEGGYPGYAPASDPRGSNSPKMYAQFVGKGIGISIDEPLAAHLAEAS